jgi:hypothetical protein
MVPRSPVRPLVVSLAAASLWAAGLAETAQAASWRTVLLAEAHLREAPVLVGDRAGGALLAWVDLPGDRPTVPINPHAAGELWAAWRSPGGNMTPMRPPTPRSARPRALAGSGDGRGGVVLAWRNGERPTGELRVALGTTAAGLGAPAAIRGAGRLPRARARLGGPAAARPAVALAARGDAVVAWLARERRGCGYAVRVAVRGGKRRRFSPGRLVSAPCAHAWNPRVALNARGVGAIAWDQGPSCPLAASACPHAIVVAPLRRGQIGVPAMLTRAAGPYAVALAAGPGGPTLAWRAFTRQSDEGVLGRVMATTADARGELGPVRAISRADRIFGTPRLAVGPQGMVLAVWQTGRPVDGTGAVQLALHSRLGGAFSAPESLRDRGVADGRVRALGAALGRDGAAAVMHCTSGLRLALGIRTAAGAILRSEPVGDSVDVSQSACAGAAPASQLAVSAAGDVLVAVTDPAGQLVLVEREGPLT